MIAHDPAPPNPWSIPALRMFTLCTLAWTAVSVSSAVAAERPDAQTVAQQHLMGVEVTPPFNYSVNWVFTDMMLHGREWRPGQLDMKVWRVVEKNGWPVCLRNMKNKEEIPIDEEHPIFMWIYNRYITGDFVLTWEGDGEVLIKRDNSQLIEDDYPKKNRRVYRWTDRASGIFDLFVVRSNPDDHVRNIHLWMPGFEGGKEVFHPLWKKELEPFSFLRLMGWTPTNDNPIVSWKNRPKPNYFRQCFGVAWEYQIQLLNEMQKDGWINIPARADDEYVRELGKLLKAELDPNLKVYVEYSNEIWNYGFKQTHWLTEQAKKEIAAKQIKDWRGRPLPAHEYLPVLAGRRSAQIWKILSEELGPERIIRPIAFFRNVDKAMEAAMDPANGDGRVDVIALNGYFMGEELNYVKARLKNWDLAEVMDVIEQLHLLKKPLKWTREIARIKRKWPNIPITCYEGGQHLANPFTRDMQGEQLVHKIFQVNRHPLMRRIYATALETWVLAGGDSFNHLSDCANWGRYGAWGAKEYTGQPLEDVVDPETGKVTERGAHKYAALLDFIQRHKDQDPAMAPQIDTQTLPAAIAGQAYSAELVASKGTPPYRWSLLGGRLPDGLDVTPDGSITGTPTKTEQLAFILNCTDSKNQHASKIMGLFMDPAAEAEMETADLSQGLPPGWKIMNGDATAVARKDSAGNPRMFLRGAGIPYMPNPAPDDEHKNPRHYTVEVTFNLRGEMNARHALGLAVALKPEAKKPESFINIVIDGMGQKLSVHNQKGGWRGLKYPLIPDEGEEKTDRAFDMDERWTIRATIRPGTAPRHMDMLISVFDEEGKSRIRTTDRTDVANGILLIRDIYLGPSRLPFGILPENAFIENIRWKIWE